MVDEGRAANWAAGYPVSIMFYPAMKAHDMALRCNPDDKEWKC